MASETMISLWSSVTFVASVLSFSVLAAGACL